MSENPTTGTHDAAPQSSPVPSRNTNAGVVKVAKYSINGGAIDSKVDGTTVARFLRNTTVKLAGPALGAGDLVLNVVTDVTEAFSDSDGGDDTTLQVRFNDGTTQTDIEAASSIGGAPWSSVSQNLMVQDIATEGDWLKLTLPTWVEVLVQNAVDIDAGLMDIYVMYVSGE